MTKGAQVTASAGPGAALRPCQCACGPSPRLETMPTPVIQASRAVSAAVSPIGQRLHREGERGCGLFHVLAKFLIREFNDTERDFSVASELAAVSDFRLGTRKARSLMAQRGGDLQRVAGFHERAKRRLIEGGKEGHARESGDANDEPA